MTKLGNKVIFDRHLCRILKRNGDIISNTSAVNNLYLFSCNYVEYPKENQDYGMTAKVNCGLCYESLRT